MADSADPTPLVFIVDDDASVCRSLSRMIRQADLDPLTFSSAEEFLSQRPAQLLRPACLVVDLKMPGLGGLKLQQALAADPAPCPVILMSGHGDIASSVEAMKQGAVTFLTKPFDQDLMLRAISDALDRHRALLAATSRVDALRKRIDGMTAREREVMSWVISGALNKQIADELGIVEQTVKVHRARVMEKMRVASVAELVRHCDTAGFEPAVK